MASIALLANSGSGSGDADAVADLLRGHGAEVSEYEIGDWERAARPGAARIAVAGGDGSIGAAAAAAAAAGVPLAVIATGTANDFAGAAGLPADVEEACEIAARGERLRAMELGRAGGRPFVNVASAGLAPIAAEEADGLKEKLGALAYPVGAVGAGATAQPIDCVVSGDGEELFAGEAWQVSVACMGAFGGGASLEADAGDGLLDLVVIEGSGRARLVKHAFGLRVGSVEGQKGVIDARCARISVTIRDEAASLNVDGELVEAAELERDGEILFEAERAAFELVVG
ncbi:MAG: diacylglycerol kinase family protein [Solirubrobacterales bacterium]